MAADYSEEPNCTQKGTGWIPFETIKNNRKKRIIKKKIRRLME